jgi:isovaleryl-CoA dehydrogenase
MRDEQTRHSASREWKPGLSQFQEINVKGLNFELGESIALMRDTVHEFAQAEIAPVAAEVDRKNEFPKRIWRRLGELGLLGITVDEEYGGAELGYLEHVVAME